VKQRAQKQKNTQEKNSFSLLFFSGRENGQAILESLLAFIILCLIFFGLLQVFHIAVADMITDYSAFFAGRAYAVGFAADENTDDWKRNLVGKAARVRAIPASGKRIFPEGTGSEKEVIKRYLTKSAQWLQYEYWSGDNNYDTAYYSTRAHPPATEFKVHSSSKNTFYLTETEAVFSDYPFILFDLMDPGRIWFTTPDNSRAEIKGTSTQLNHAVDYLEE
jgi:hypothetical protein